MSRPKPFSMIRELSWLTWPSRQARDEGWKKVMPFDGKRLVCGGFEMIVSA